MKTIKNLFSHWYFLAIPIISGASISTALAQTSAPPQPITTQANLKLFICNIITYFIWILIAISVIMVLVGAFDYITAGDDTEKTTRGRKRITYAAIGIAIALLAYGFPLIVQSAFGTLATGTLTGVCG